MKCPKCNNEILGDSKHCSSCGCSIENNNVNIPSNLDIIRNSKAKVEQFEEKVYQERTKTSSHMGKVVIIIFALSMIAFTIASIYFTLSPMDFDIETDYIVYDEDKIPSLYLFFEDVRVCRMSKNNINNVEYHSSYEICSSDITDDDLDDYLNFLIKEGYEVVESDYSRSVFKYAENDNYILVVSVDYETNTVYYEKKVSDELLDESVSA